MTSSSAVFIRTFYLPAPPCAREVSERCSERLGRRIAEVAARDGFEQHLVDRPSNVEVHLGNPYGEHVGLVLRPLHASAKAEEWQREIVETTGGMTVTHGSDVS